MASSSDIKLDGTQLTLAAEISGPGDLSKLGNGKLVLPVANSYMGSTFIEQGTINLRNAGAARLHVKRYYHQEFCDFGTRGRNHRNG